MSCMPTRISQFVSDIWKNRQIQGEYYHLYFFLRTRQKDGRVIYKAIYLIETGKYLWMIEIQIPPIKHAYSYEK